MDTALALVILAVVVNALLVGASLDQSIKQLPTRHRIGVVAYSEYQKAADLRNGVPWYASLGVTALGITLAAAVTGLLDPHGGGEPVLWCAIAFTVAHSACTVRAAPTNFSQRQAAGDAQRLAVILDRFTRWQTARMIFQVLSLVAMVWALFARVHFG